MFVITNAAAEAIRAIIARDGGGGVRIGLADVRSNGRGPGVTLQPAPAPDFEDAVIEVDGFALYVDGRVLDMLEDKVLDAEDHGGAVRFSVRE